MPEKVAQWRTAAAMCIAYVMLFAGRQGAGTGGGGIRSADTSAKCGDWSHGISAKQCLAPAFTDQCIHTPLHAWSQKTLCQVCLRVTETSHLSVRFGGWEVSRG